MKLATLGMDSGESELCRVLPQLDDSIILTSDHKAVSALCSGDAAITAPFVNRVCLFGEVASMLLAWKSYDDLKIGFDATRFRRWELEDAMCKEGINTTEFDFRQRMSQSHKECVARLGGVCRCSWP